MEAQCRYRKESFPFRLAPASTTSDRGLPQRIRAMFAFHE